MKLRDYLTENHIRVSAFAAQIGVHRVSLSRYLGGARPDADVIERIMRETNGNVMPNDWFEDAA